MKTLAAIVDKSIYSKMHQDITALFSLTKLNCIGFVQKAFAQLRSHFSKTRIKCFKPLFLPRIILPKSLVVHGWFQLC